MISHVMSKFNRLIIQGPDFLSFMQVYKVISKQKNKLKWWVQDHYIQEPEIPYKSIFSFAHIVSYSFTLLSKMHLCSLTPFYLKSIHFVGFHGSTYQDFPGRSGSSLVGTGLTCRVSNRPCCHRPTGIPWLLPLWTRAVSTLVADYLAGPFAKFYSLHFLVICFTDVFICNKKKITANCLLSHSHYKNQNWLIVTFFMQRQWTCGTLMMHFTVVKIVWYGNCE